MRTLSPIILAFCLLIAPPPLAAESESGYFDWTDIFLPSSNSNDREARQRIARLETELERLRVVERELQQARSDQERQRRELAETRLALTAIERELRQLQAGAGRGRGAANARDNAATAPPPPIVSWQSAPSESAAFDAQAIRWNLLYPGMGHIRRDYPIRGWSYAIGFGLSGALTLWSYSQEQNLRAGAGGLDALFSDGAAKYNAARLRTQNLLLLTVGIYAVSLADAAWTFSAPLAFDERGAPMLRLQLSARF